LSIFSCETFVAADNSEFQYKYEKLDLPVDGEGYCKAFDVKEVEEFCAFFEKYGVVVIKDVLTEEECSRSESEVWDLIGRMSRNKRGGEIKRDDPDTWESWIELSKIGILGNDCILSKQMFENRQNPKIYESFRQILGKDDLMVTVSRASMMRPTKDVKFSDGVRNKPEWKTIEGWLHWDMNMWTGWTTTFSWKVLDNSQNRGYDRLRVQGWVSVVDCGPADGGFHCVPGFSSHMRGWAYQNKDKFNPKRFDTTFQVPADDPIRKDIQRVAVRKGSLVIWNSKTPHGTFPNDSSHGRMIQYITMADENDPSIGRLFDDESLLPPDFQLTQLGRKLLGFKQKNRFWPL